ncbi:MAG: MFS transporter [Gammaproteobacteria bacterium]|nr:MFS transporter [Gammaproteobacteria bacterium]
MPNSKLILWSITASLAGFLFGFDTVVISGAEQTIQQLWNLSSTQHGIAISIALWGTVAGALIGGWPTEQFGRQRTLLSIGIFYLSSALGSAFAPDLYSFMIARFIGGVGVGISTVAAPLYIAEISPAKHRGKLAGMFQFNIVFGILVAYLSNSSLSEIGENAWRWMLGVEVLPSCIFTILCFWLPESPRWLISHGGRKKEAVAVFRLVSPDSSTPDLEKLANEIELNLKETEQQELRFFSTQLKFPILLAFLIAFFNQLSGINAILYFAPRIFSLTGLEQSAALLQSIGIGVTNLVFTFIGLWLIDRLGRRQLLTIGCFGYITSLGLCSVAFATENYSIVPICIFSFIASHAVGQGAVIWVFISEIFPNRYRASGQALGSSTHWVFAALLTLFFPIAVEAIPPAIVFAFFCFMMLLQLLWIRVFVPETKGVILEQMQTKVMAKSSLAS